MQVEQLERRVLAERQALMSRPNTGLSYADLPSYPDAREAFETWLVSEPEVLDPLHLARLKALGMA